MARLSFNIHPHGGAHQQWTIASTSGGYVRIVARHSGKVLDVEGGSMDDGAQVIQYVDHRGANQEWVLRPVASMNDALQGRR